MAYPCPLCGGLKNESGTMCTQCKWGHPKDNVLATIDNSVVNKASIYSGILFWGAGLLIIVTAITVKRPIEELAYILLFSMSLGVVLAIYAAYFSPNNRYRLISKSVVWFSFLLLLAAIKKCTR